MKRFLVSMIAVSLIMAVGGCTKRTPSIAHVHIGHAMTGWHDTPNKEGLFVVAQKLAQEALEYSQKATAVNRDLNQIKKDVIRISRLTDGSAGQKEEQKKHYGVKQALKCAISHLTFAAMSHDATDNTRAFADRFAANATGVLDRCDLIVALSQDIGASESIEEAQLLAPEIHTLVKANIEGEDLNNDGRIGSNAEEYGLAQLRQNIENMIAREDPPYATVASWYLFNLIRLPDGSWIFRKRQSQGSGGPHDSSNGAGNY